MERLVIDADGKVAIPPEILQRRGLHPGDELALVEAAEGLLLYQNDMDAEVKAWAENWWNSLTEDEKREARQEADWYESLTEEQRDALWNQFPVSIEEKDEGDEIDITTLQPAA
ncbi:MAG TPA: AbrB/MazE/SpoVT family DNA-binding domain-containing protein [Blastocatellia bacterium]|nr:AbrB/MazE/SpoVT family DNA-binding domain-containing protein [Blastocatellia bacterium]